jgi:hypothetical protein
MNLTIINRYTCPIHGKITIQAHKVQDGTVIKSYGKMSIDDIDIFTGKGFVIVCDVSRSSNLKDYEIINNK